MISLLWIVNSVLIVVVVFLLFWRFWFLRDPQRDVPKGDVFVSPADGKVLKIVDLDKVDKIKIKKGLVGKIKTICSDVSKSCYLVSIYMTPFDVHIQRASQSGKVVSVKHKDGKLGLTKYFKNGLLNEKTETLIENDSLGKFKIIQIAGFVVRRINSWVSPNQNLAKGQRIGLINFGSQVCIILPKKKVSLTITEGQKVYAGSTTIAKVK